MIKKDKWLITIDLDGTLLNSPGKDMFDEDGVPVEGHHEYNGYNLEVINKLQAEGHKVAIVTGRPWNHTEEVYKSLGLKTIVANYNGAHVHYPGNDAFVPLVSSINKEILADILEEDIIKNNYKGVVIGMLEKNLVWTGTPEETLKRMHLTDKDSFIEWEYNGPISVNPQSALIEIKYDQVDPFDILKEMRRKYGASMLFRLWDARDYGWLVLEINQKASNKGSALEYIAAYYNIPMTNTIAFGDGLNDREMIVKAAHGVAMKNAKGTVKTYSNDITDYDNNDAGVGKYLEEFFELK